MLPNMLSAYKYLNPSQILLLQLWGRRVRQRVVAEQSRITSMCVDVKPQWSCHNLLCQIPLQSNQTVAEWICRAMEAGPECWWDFGFLGIQAAEVWFGPTTGTRVVVVAQEDEHTIVSMETIHEQQTAVSRGGHHNLPRLYVTVVPVSSESPNDVQRSAAWNPNSLIQSHATDPGLNSLQVSVHRDPSSCGNYWTVAPNATIRGTVVRRSSNHLQQPSIAQSARMLKGSLYVPIITVTPTWLQPHSYDNNAKAGERQVIKSIKCSIPDDDETTISQWIQETMEKAPDEWWNFWGLPARDADVWFGESSWTRMICKDDDGDALGNTQYSNEENANKRRRTVPRHVLMMVPKVYITVSSNLRTASNSSDGVSATIRAEERLLSDTTADAWNPNNSVRSHMLGLIEMSQYSQRFPKEEIELQLHIVPKPLWTMPAGHHHYNPHHPTQCSIASLNQSATSTTARMKSEQPVRVFVRHTITTDDSSEGHTASSPVTAADEVAEVTIPAACSNTKTRINRNKSAYVSGVPPSSSRRIRTRISRNDVSSLRITRSQSKSASKTTARTTRSQSKSASKTTAQEGEEIVVCSDDTGSQSNKKKSGPSKRERSTPNSKNWNPKSEHKTSYGCVRPVARITSDPYSEEEDSIDDAEQRLPLSKKHKQYKMTESADSNGIKTQSSSYNNTGILEPVRHGDKNIRHRAIVTFKSRQMTRSKMVVDDYLSESSFSNHRHGQQAMSIRNLRPMPRSRIVEGHDSSNPSSSHRKKNVAAVTPSPRKCNSLERIIAQRTTRSMDGKLKEDSTSGEVNIGRTLLRGTTTGSRSQLKGSGNRRPVTRSRLVKDKISSLDIPSSQRKNQRFQKEVVSLGDTSCSNAVQHAIQVEANIPSQINMYMKTPISNAADFSRTLRNGKIFEYN